MARIDFAIEFSGKLAENHELDFYDAAHALVGFQRSLALSAHLIANGEVITQAPALKNAEILSLPPEAGSWRTRAVMALGGVIGGLAIAPHDSVAGNIAISVYDYVLKESMGVHADYSKTISQLIDEKKENNPGLSKITQPKLDSLIEKCQRAVIEMHRPIVWSETASKAQIVAHHKGHSFPVGPTMTQETYRYINFTTRSKAALEEVGRISGYDSNTYKGRMYLHSELRSVPFELSEDARTIGNIRIITNNLAANAQGRETDIRVRALRETSRTDQLKRLIIMGAQA